MVLLGVTPDFELGLVVGGIGTTVGTVLLAALWRWRAARGDVWRQATRDDG
jgi:hypothetical protein